MKLPLPLCQLWKSLLVSCWSFTHGQRQVKIHGHIVPLAIRPAGTGTELGLLGLLGHGGCIDQRYATKQSQMTFTDLYILYDLKININLIQLDSANNVVHFFVYDYCIRGMTATVFCCISNLLSLKYCNSETLYLKS